MKVEILGTRAKIKPSAPGYKNHTGFLIDDQILLDVGEENFLEKNPKAIVFTHFHPDHAFFVPEQLVFNPKIPHYGPEEHELLPQLQIITKPFELQGYKFTPVPVIHALRLKSLGYVVEKGAKRIFFTGDVAWIEKAYLEDLGKLDLIITEATFIKKGGRINRKGNQIFGHTGVPDLIRLLGQHTPKIVFTHFGEWFYADVKRGPDKIRGLKQGNPELIPAHDGYIIEV